MEIVGSLHVIRSSEPHTLGWKYVVVFVPYDGELDKPPERECVDMNDLQAIMSGLRLSRLVSLRCLVNVYQDSVSTVRYVRTSDDRLRELGFS